MHSNNLQPLLVVFAHPDDEFAVFPWLRHAVDEGRPVEVVWLTNGGWGGQSIERRLTESRIALISLGVPLSGCCFWGAEHGIEDGKLHEYAAGMLDSLLEKYGQEHAGGEVMMPAWEGGHHDHDASHMLGMRIAQARGARMTQYSLYHGEGLWGPWFRVLSPLTANGRVEVLKTSLKERIESVYACLTYRSQWKSFVGLLPFYMLRMLQSDAFVKQQASVSRLAQRPHSGPLLYERRGGPSWDEFSVSMQSILEQLREEC